MARVNNIKLKSLEKTRNYLIWELKRSESLTKNEKSKYQVALESINQIIRQKELSKGKEKTKYFSKVS